MTLREQIARALALHGRCIRAGAEDFYWNNVLGEECAVVPEEDGSVTYIKGRQDYLAEVDAILSIPAITAALAGRDAVLEEAAQMADCNCPHKAKVLAVPPNSGARWRACVRDDCAAINAADIRALKTGDAPARAALTAALTPPQEDGT
jgi:hypothetical protein